jgi:15-cis-phytoene synthase
MMGETDIEACRTMLRGGSRTFFAASKVLPTAVAEPAIALYAFCREADDAVDSGGGSKAVARLNARLDRIYQGSPFNNPVDRAFADAVRHFAIPRELPQALLEGLAWDTQARRYDSESDLIAYAVRVAGTVGAMMALLMQRREPMTVARACDLGIAMQLTNIARDVGEDARAGRLYLPRRWLQEAGLDPEAWLAAPCFDARLASVIRRLLDLAELFYAQARSGIGDLPMVCRPGIHAARLIYAEIGHELARSGFDSVSRRAVVSPAQKLKLLARAFADCLRAPASSLTIVQPEARFLIDAVVASPAAPRRAPPRPPAGRVVWVINLFERLERREQMLRESRAS